MYRKVYKELISWKNSPSRKPLLLLGARQVGKTWLMKEFGTKEYKNVVYINCDTEPLTKTLFLEDYDISRLLLGFQAISGESITEGETLLILDEIQEAPRGLHSLKYFCENAPGYHVMAAGSLLGVTLAQHESFPVGKVDMLKIYPMTFLEFLSAVGQEQLARLLESKDFGLIDSFTNKLETFLRQYYFIGGMPEVVKTFVETNDLNRVRYIQTTIIDAYRADISKHTSKTESIRIGQVLSSLPSQLTKENRKFIYGVIKKGSRASDFELAIQWLVDAGLVYKVNRVNKIAMPLKFYEDIAAFKLFFLDVGLLACMAGIPAADIVFAASESAPEFKGMIAEEYVAQELFTAGLSPRYWSNENSTSEIDFIVQTGGRVCAIEVKSSTNVRGKSLSMYLAGNPDGIAVRYSLRSYKVQERLTNYPLFAVGVSFG